MAVPLAKWRSQTQHVDRGSAEYAVEEDSETGPPQSLQKLSLRWLQWPHISGVGSVCEARWRQQWLAPRPVLCQSHASAGVGLYVPACWKGGPMPQCH